MAEDLKREQAGKDEDPFDLALLSTDDPGGSRTKGYTAEPGPLVHVPEEGALPLAPEAEIPAAIHVPERDEFVHPTGRGE